MKKNNYQIALNLIFLLLFFTALSSYGQSLTILPEQVRSDNATGDNITLRSSNSLIGLQSYKYNGTTDAETAVTLGQSLLRIGGGGYYLPASYYSERAAMYFVASQNWGPGASGARITFWTTPLNTNATTERLTIYHDGNIGINTPAPKSKLHITHLAVSDNPHLLLESTSSAASVIRAISTRSGKWENRFATSDTAAANIVSWVNTTFSKTPLKLTGEGDAIIERNASVGGYTSLGGAAAPKIKMKELSLTTSGASSGTASIAHGLTQAKILSVSILVNATTGSDIPPSYKSTVFTGFEYYFFVLSTTIVIENSSGNHANIAGRPARILITYKE
ncbi:hypothetical protein [Emticicia sp. BO119]|uniref:hypothetical protein n=1 Tax=Emticicia sp. BO119 TaxID=2757768 RepID=UPI0015EFFCEF|nr:hypothetical protein [Emticicia sp. BO119]MBA4851209.1 hypothetical protein [Emticicia sp. BO119]